MNRGIVVTCIGAVLCTLTLILGWYNPLKWIAFAFGIAGLVCVVFGFAPAKTVPNKDRKESIMPKRGPWTCFTCGVEFKTYSEYNAHLQEEGKRVRNNELTKK